MIDDNDSIAELKEKAAAYNDLGWHSHAERVRERISELEQDKAKSTSRRAIEMLAEKHRQEKHGDEIAQLEEKLEWYEEFGWDAAADLVRTELELLRSDD